MEAPGSVLIVKLSAIGDVLHTLPFLEVIRRSWPGARVDWVVEESAAPIVLGHPALDRVIVSRRKEWERRFVQGSARPAVLREAWRFLRELRAERYDLVVDLQGLLKSGVLTGFARGGQKVGMQGGREGAGLFLKTVVPVDYEQHAILRYLSVAAALGCETTGWKGAVPLAESDTRNVAYLFEKYHWGARPLVAINPMAKWRTKLWESRRFAELADRLRHELNVDVVFTGSAEDRPRIDSMVAAMRKRGAPPVNLAGRTGLKTLAGLYSAASLLVSTDTGPMHMAAAMGCPVVALFGPTAPWRTGPYGSAHHVVRAEVACSPCFRKRCDDMTCMGGITVDAVMQKVEQTLENRDPGAETLHLVGRGIG